MPFGESHTKPPGGAVLDYRMMTVKFSREYTGISDDGQVLEEAEVGEVQSF